MGVSENAVKSSVGTRKRGEEIISVLNLELAQPSSSRLFSRRSRDFKHPRPFLPKLPPSEAWLALAARLELIGRAETRGERPGFEDGGGLRRALVSSWLCRR